MALTKRATVTNVFLAWSPLWYQSSRSRRRTLTVRRLRARRRMFATEEAEAETRAEDVVHTEAASSTSMQTTEESEAEMRAADVDETDAQSSGSTQTTQAWQAVFCPRAHAWYFYDAKACDEATWDRPSEVSLIHWHAPAVPEPWVVMRK